MLLSPFRVQNLCYSTITEHLVGPLIDIVGFVIHGRAVQEHGLESYVCGRIQVSIRDSR
jgi:hypothetical protein